MIGVLSNHCDWCYYINMEQTFKAYNKYYEEETERRDKIKLELRKFDTILRDITTCFSVIHQRNLNDDVVKQSLQKANTLFAQCKDIFSNLNNLIPKDMYYKYNNLWQSHMSSCKNIIITMIIVL